MSWLPYAGLGGRMDTSIKAQCAKRIAWAMLWLTPIALYVSASLCHLDSYAWDYDEGPYLQAAALAFRGYPLYRQVVLNKLPFLTWLLEGSFALGGATLTVARFTILMLNLVSFIGLGKLAELWWGKGAGPATMLTYLLIPESVVRAAVVMNDLPAMSTALLALLAATLFRRSRRLGWLVLSAVAYVLAVGLHPLLLFMGLPVGWVLIAPEPHALLDLRHMARTAMVFGIVGLVVLGGTLLLVDSPGLFRWVYEYNATSARNAAVRISTWPSLREYLSAHWALAAAALSGSLLLFRKRFWLGISLLWTYLTWITLYLYRPLWDHYRIFLLYPLVVLAGGGVANGIRQGLQATYHPPARRLIALFSLCLMLLFGFQRVSTPSIWPEWPAGHAEAYAYVGQECAPGDFVVSDNQFLAFVHGYVTPPSLADTSFKRIHSDHLEIGEVVQAIREYGVDFLVLDFNEGRFYHFHDFMQGIEAITEPPTCFAAFCVYRVRPIKPANALLGNAVRLIGYTLTPEAGVYGGETLTVTLYWESIAPLGADLSVFAHMLDSEGTLRAQHDGSPLYNNLPTSTWRTGMVIPDPHPIVIDPHLLPGTYTIAVGMYRPSGERLPAQNADGERWRDDRILLTTVSVAGL